MKNIYLILLLLVIGTFTFVTSCAKRGTINGGSKDTIAPKITSSSPDNFSTNFSGKEIKIYFNELIKVKDINKQLIISPPLEKKPLIIPQGSASKFISVKLLDEPKPNTTYSFNFGQSITDNNEGNPYSQFKYVFSTGTYIDSLVLAGRIKDAYEQKPDNFVSIQLYDATTFQDSTIYKETPLYITNTLDSLKVFALENLKAGEYRIIALKDKNNNYKYDPKSDKVAFIDESITLPIFNTIYELELFKEEPELKFDRPIQQSNNKFFIGFQGDAKGVKVSAKMGEEEVPFRITRYPEKERDSLQLFFPISKPDSLVISVKKGDYIKSFKTKIKELKLTDSLDINPTQSNLNFRDSYSLKTKTPINTIDKSKIILLNKDSLAIPFEYNYDEFEQKIFFDFKKEESQKYQIELLPGAITDFYSTQNDSLLFTFSTKALSDYGNLNVTVKNIDRFPYILEILTDKGEIIAREARNDDQPIFFESIEPRIYTLRVIYDDNKNNIWDTGSYLEKRQAEQIIYFPKGVDIRANWDVEQEFDLEE
ncbi:Ig-like domain-containing protein [Flavobacterium sp.]|uniref:Ig-like domain-containing protein n=1 Tax=Flavobacterium sp. TaxID=239 RepID=UPI0040477BF1